MSQSLLEHRSPDATVRLHGGAVLEVFLHMLMSADGNGEFTLESARTMSKRLGLSERTVFRALKRLEAEGYISTVVGVTTNYRSAMRRINPVSMWPKPTPSAVQRKRERDRQRMAEKRASDNSGQESATSPESVSSRSDLSYISTTNYQLLTNNSQLDTSYLVARERDSRVCLHLLASAEGIDIVARKKPVDPDEGCDAWDAKLDEEYFEDTLSPEAQKAAKDAWIEENRKRIVAERKKSRPSPTQDLAVYFKAIGQTSEQVGSTNLLALAATFSGWVREGSDYATIRKWIKAYWSDDFKRSRSKAAWLDFIARKEEVRALLSDLERIESGESVFAGFKWN